MSAETLPGLLHELAGRRPNGIAFRRKHLGIWRATSLRMTFSQASAFFSMSPRRRASRSRSAFFVPLS